MKRAGYFRGRGGRGFGLFTRPCLGRIAVVLALAAALPAGAGVDIGIILQTSPLAGFQYHAGRAIFPLMRPGDRLELHREPDNPHDPKAVRVDWRGVPIGYVPRVDNADLARLMDGGARAEARILHLQPGRNPWRRVLMEIQLVQ
jgi:HIRAN domain